MKSRVLSKSTMNELNEVLGPIEMARFINEFDLGTGDYTKEKYDENNYLASASSDEIMTRLAEYEERRKNCSFSELFDV